MKIKHPSQIGRPQSPSRSRPRLAGGKVRWLVGGAAMAVLAAGALLNRAKARRVEATSPPAGAFVEVGGVRLHYLERGSGRVVLLLHGNGVTLQDFEVSGVLGLVAKTHRVIAFDRPGFGYSDRPRSTIWTPRAQAALIAAALKQLGIEKAIVVGHSWGAMVALAMALDHPGQVTGLVLMSGYYYPTVRPDVVPSSLPAIPVVGDLLAHTVSPISAALLGPAVVKASFAPAPVPEKFKSFPAGLALRPSQIRATAADSALMVPGAADLSSRYAQLHRPVVVMAGEGDVIVPVAKQAQRLVGELPESELRIVPGQGHLFHYAVPEQVAAAIDTVVARSNA